MIYKDVKHLQQSKVAAIDFLRNCVRGGLAHSFDTQSEKWVKPYPEVTGYLVSLFSCKDQQDLNFAIKMADKLIKLQTESGGWKTFYGDYVYTFDTAQISKGLIDLYFVTSEDRFLNAAIRGANFICNMQTSEGGFFPMYLPKYNERVVLNDGWGESFSPINSKCCEFLTAITNANLLDCSDCIRRSSLWTLSQNQIKYTHPGAYSLEGLWAAGYVDEVKSRLENFFLPRLEKNGFISYNDDLSYSYVSGSIQVAILCYLVGFYNEALIIYDWASKVQRNNLSGGIFQFANYDGSINLDVHGEINSWGTKYYVELINLLSKG